MCSRRGAWGGGGKGDGGGRAKDGVRERHKSYGWGSEVEGGRGRVTGTTELVS